MLKGLFNFSVKKAVFAAVVAIAALAVAAPFVFIQVFILSVTYSVVPSEGADAQRTEQLRALIADYDERNWNLRLTEAVNPDDRKNRHLEIQFSNLDNGQAAVLDRLPELTVSVNYQHNGCDSSTVTDYSEPVLFNHALAGIQSYLSSVSERSYESPDSKTFANNLLNGEPEKRANIDRLGSDALMQSINLGLNYSRENLPFAEWEQYTIDVTAYNAAAREYSEAVTELNCMLDASENSFATYADIEIRPPTIRHALINRSGASTIQQNAINNAFRMYQEANPDLQLQSVLDSSGNAELRLQFGTLNNLRASARVGSDRFTIGADYRGCDARQYDYSQNALTNHVLDAITSYIDEHISADTTSFRTPANLSTTDNLLNGEIGRRMSIANLSRDAIAQRESLNAANSSGNLPFAEWGDYASGVATHNATIDEYDEAVAQLNCMLNVSDSPFDTYADIETPAPTIRYILTGGSSLSAARRNAITDAVARYRETNPNLLFQPVTSVGTGTDLRLQFGRLTNEQTTMRVDSDRFTISSALRGCDARYSDYSYNALVNNTLDAIASYVEQYTTSFTEPAKLNTENNLLNIESAIRQRIRDASNIVQQGDDYLRQFRLDDRIPYESWNTYSSLLSSRNINASDHNADARSLNCMLNETVISTTYSQVEAKRREGHYYFAVASMIGYDGYFDRIARNSADAWAQLNSRLDFTMVEAGAEEIDFYIEYLDIPNNSDGAVGWHCPNKCTGLSYSYRQTTDLQETDYPEILVDTNGRSCSSEIVHYTELYIQDVTMHEIGHFLGLGHAADMNHLLYSSRRPAPMDPFDNMGLNVPAIPNWQYTRLGIAEATTELDNMTLYREASGKRIVATHNLSRARFLHDRIQCLRSNTRTDIVPNGSSVTGNISESGDENSYRITIPSAGVLTLYSTGNTDVVGTLYSSDSSEGEIDLDDDDGSGSNFRISENLSAGTYNLEVRGYDSSVTGSYSVWATFSPRTAQNGQHTNQTDHLAHTHDHDHTH